MKTIFYVCLCLLTGAAIAQNPMPTQPVGMFSPAQVATQSQYISDVTKATNGIGTLITANDPTTGGQVTSATAAVIAAVGLWQVAPTTNGTQLAQALRTLNVSLATIPTATGTSIAPLISTAMGGVTYAFIHIPQTQSAAIPTTSMATYFVSATIPHVGNNTPDQDFRAAWNAAAGGVQGAPTL